MELTLGTRLRLEGLIEATRNVSQGMQNLLGEMEASPPTPAGAEAAEETASSLAQRVSRLEFDLAEEIQSRKRWEAKLLEYGEPSPPSGSLTMAEDLAGRRMLGQTDSCPTHGPYQSRSGVCPLCWTVIERWARGKKQALDAAKRQREVR